METKKTKVRMMNTQMDMLQNDSHKQITILTNRKTHKKEKLKVKNIFYGVEIILSIKCIPDVLNFRKSAL